MKQENIDIKKLFTDNLCTFEMAKKAAAAGMTCANTYFAYDAEDGSLTDGAWLKDIRPDIKMYPAINLAFSIEMLEDCDLQLLKLVCYRFNNKYFLKEGDSLIAQRENLVDLFVATWIKYKKPDTGPLPPIDPTVHDGSPPPPISSEPVN